MFEEDLTTLEDQLRRLKVEYDIFFNGNRKRPPEDLKARMEKLVKKLSQATTMTFTERFRFNTLVARFSLYRDVWRRMTAKLESGTEKETQASPDKIESKAQTAATADELRIRIDDPKSQQDRIRVLYEALVRLNQNQPKNTPQISFNRFAGYVEVQTNSIRQKYKCSGVIFTLCVEEDTIKFRATAAENEAEARTPEKG